MNLTSPQKNVIETEQFFKNTAISNIGGYMFFEKSIDTDFMDKAINKILEKADGLRIKLSIDGLKISQEICEYKYENIEVINIKNNVEKTTNEWMKEPFDLQGKLYEFKIMKLDGKTGIFIKLHHLISDAWSMSLILSKLIEYYNSLINKIEICDELPTYKDFIETDIEYLSGNKIEKDKEYWNKKYDSKPTFVTLSSKQLDFDARAERKTFTISSEEKYKIEKYCSDNNISIAVFFESIVSLYAIRINNTEDITLCSLNINRSGIKEKETIGMFNNILPMTVYADWNDKFIDFCNKIAEEHYQMFRHQKYPYSMIMDDLREKYGQSNIYDIMVSYQNARIKTNGSIDFKTNWNFNGYSELSFMMNISDIDDSGTLNIDIDYRKNCFTQIQIESIYKRLMYIKNQILKDYNIKFNEIEIITLDEREQILKRFNDTKKEYPKNKCIHEFIEENARINPDKVALRFKSREMTYKEFNEKSNCVANYIMKNNNEHNAIIGVMLERSFEMMIAIYGILKAGCAYMPIDPNFPKDRIEFMLEDSRAKLIFSCEKFADILSSNINIIKMDEFKYGDYEKFDVQNEIAPTDRAYIIYTSGSTGKPKGAQIMHHSVINRIKWMHEKYPLCLNDVILQKTPYTFDVSVWELFWWSMYDGSLEILIPEGHKDPQEIISSIDSGKVTHMHFVPSMLNAFLCYLNNNRELISKLKTLKYVFASGEALQSEHVRNFYNLLGDNGTTLHNLYGPTECTVDVSYYDCERDNIPDNIPIGKPIDNTELLILDKSGKLLPIGVPGELYISGVLVCKGYINREELTKEKFVPNTYYPYDKMYKTGDLAKWLSDGNIEYLGRIDNQVKIRGLRVELGDIESAILKYKNINECVVNVFEMAGEKNLCGYFTATNNIDIEKLKKYLSKILPEYMVPSYYMQLPKIPVNHNGKVDRKSLPKPVITNDMEYIAPEGEIETQIQKCVLSIMKIDNIGVTNDLLSCGLTSLGVITIITELSIYGWNIKVRDFYENRTIRGLASIIKNQSIQTDDYIEDKKYIDVSDIKKAGIKRNNKKSIFLTGVTGFLGINILEELLKNKDISKVYCLIRNKEKFESYINKYTNLEIYDARIAIVMGDITEYNLGMSVEEYNDIVNDISDIIHSAANVSHFCSWEKAKKINYIGTYNIITLAKDSNAKLHHISTMSVSGDILTAQTVDSPEFDEDKLYIGQLYKDNVYSYSKYLAEKEIIKAIRDNKINANIYRLPNLTWRVKDGVFQENYKDNDLYILTKVMQKINLVPEELKDENILLAPVDDLARAIVLLLKKEENNNIYHLISTNSPSVFEYISYLTDVNIVSMDEIYNKLKKSPNDNQMQFVAMYLSGILSDAAKMLVKIKSEKTNNILEKLGFEWGKIDEKYIEKFNDITK